MKLHLCNNKGFKWYSNEGVHVKGYIIDDKNNYYEQEELVEFFINIKTLMDFKERLSKANGFFSVIINKKDKVYACVDRLRSFPLFYNKKGEIYLSDNPYFIKDEIKEINMDKLSQIELMIARHVTGSDTLYSNIKQIKAGELLEIDKINKKIKTESYFKFKHEDYFKSSSNDLIEELDQVHIRVFKRLIKSLNGRTAVVPLSGGHDSRLVVTMLKRLGYEKVLCFTYGKKGNWESKISKKVAEKLGYKWMYIKCNRKKWHKIYNSENRKKYSKYAGNLISIPHFQDFLAVSEMKDRGLIPEDGVFVPGHTGDFIQGGHIPKEYEKKNIITKSNLVSSILKKHYNLWRWQKESPDFLKNLSDKITNLTSHDVEFTNDEAANLFELWEWQERQAKFICNSVRAYDYYDHEWRLPLWDNEMMHFWSRVTLEKRIGRRLYYEYAKEKQVEFLDIQANPKITKVEKLYNRVFDDKYGRYTKSGNVMSLLFTKNKDVFDNREFDFIDNDKRIILESLNSLEAMSYLNLIKNEQRS